MRDLISLPHRLNPDHGTCVAVVECPQGDRCKFAYEPELGGFELKRLLPAGMTFPLNFGFIPSTKAEDGDPLDIMVINDVPLPMGAITEVRLIGSIEAEQTEEEHTVRNDRLVGVAASSLLFGAFCALDELPLDFIDSLTTFWTQYERLRGVTFKVLAVQGVGSAVAAVQKASKGSR
jgi:inorganic pyrophosphatase